jgi:hypothetical protein
LSTALLYIVPAILGALFLHAALRGEVGKLWQYQEHVAEQAEQEVAAAEADVAAKSAASKETKKVK